MSLRKFLKSRERFVHVSQEFVAVDHPVIRGLKVWVPKFVDSAGMPKGKTYCVGRNAAKRLLREHGLRRTTESEAAAYRALD